MTDCTNETVNEIKNLKRKCALQQNCHYELASRVSFSSKVLNVSLVLLSAVTVLSTTDHVEVLLDADSKLLQRHISALFSVLVFLLMLLKLELRLAEIASSFKAGGDAFTRFLRKVDMLLPTLDSKQANEIERLGAQLTDEYTRITDFARDIPTHDFLRLKQRHLQQIAKSRALDTDPFLSLKDIKGDLQNDG